MIRKGGYGVPLATLRQYLLPLYAVATLFPRLFQLPPPLSQLQLTELLFLPLLWAFRHELPGTYRRFPTFSLCLAAYVAANLLSAGWAGNAGTLLEGAARAYLGMVALLTLTHLRCYGPRTVERWWKLATVVVAGGALLYYAAVLSGYLSPGRGVSLYRSYPYLGDVLRLRATGSTPGMWVMLLLPGALFALHRRKAAPGGVSWGWVIVATAMVPSWSKELLLLGAGTILVCWPRGAWPKVIAGGLAAALLFGTHYLLVAEQAPDREQLQYRGQHTGVELLGHRLVETVYLPIKRVTLRVGAAHPLLGVGPGNFADHSEAATREDELPPGFGRFDPHSTWLGAFAETGLPGLFALLFLVVAAWRSRGGEDVGPAAVLLLLFLVASVFKDVANFRGLWVLAGMYLAGGLPPQELPPAAPPKAIKP